MALWLCTPIFGYSQLNTDANSNSQSNEKKNKYTNGGGQFQLGLRTTTSLFGETGNPGLGFGGQFRIKFAKRLNSEWFADVINTDIDGLGRRFDTHIGWSVMFYLKEEMEHPHTPPKFMPYLIAGHCFDYTRVTPYSKPSDDRSDEMLERWSSATQAGLGVHWNFNRKADISLSSQYMIHLGKDVHTDIEEVNGEPYLHVEETNDFSLEGHLLLTLSLNIKIGELW